ncbi:ABC-2 family transporter protein [Pseudoalteromonas viridis]|uniref:ABC-2 family transporter protein n=1 Tax=Pseudoalteromonas viridis TaxID=339617 RepID=A0ABX7V6E2_9GAMM|nr:ABC-2 family transporter protein [Pseudoalteromonas viridis]QTL36459.1 ABC-2 family transporter protein [Pseudoalteromonas viridis]
MGSFISLLRLQLRQFTAFRFDTFTKLAGYPLQLGMMVLLWGFLEELGTGFDTQAIIAYYAIIFVCQKQYPFVRLSFDVQVKIFKGDIFRNYVKPIPLINELFAKFCVQAMFYLLIALPLALLVVMQVSDVTLTVPRVLGFFVLCMGSAVLCFLLWYMVGLTAFFTVMNRGAIQLFNIIQDFAKGAIIPLSLLPEAWNGVLAMTPFPHMAHTSAAYLTQIEPMSFWYAFLMQWVWIGITYVCCAALWHKGVQRDNLSLV